MREAIAVLGGALGLVALALAEDPAAAPRIRVGPNILVSRDGDVAHCETMIAADPKNAKNLIGGSITMTRADGSSANKAYVSRDGGSTWTDVGFPEEIEHGGGDPQVGFGIGGTAYFVGLSNGTNFYRSEDGGRTWGKALNLGSSDHEMLITDQTLGSYAGRVYLTAETDQKGSNELEDLIMRRQVVLFRSSDDGRSFVGPITVAVGDGRGLAAYNLLVLSDGTLFIPMSEYPNYAREKEASTWKAVFSLSTDGGVTFSPKKKIAEISFGGLTVLREQQKSGRVDQIGGPVYASGPGGKFRDRIHSVWTELDGGRFRLVSSHSSDRGETWSKPRPVDPGAPASASEFQQMAAVNPDGVLGVFWYSTEGFPGRDQFHVYFAASLDGGETFLPKTRISSEASRPFGAGNLRPGPYVRPERGLVTVSLVSGMSRWPDGGDYIGMTADADGVFHPFWADGRSGTYQLYTAAVRVETAAAPGRPAGLEKVSLAEKVTLVMDPIQYDQGKREILMPVRLKNISKETLYPPFTVEIKEFAPPYAVKSGDKHSEPVILNAANGKQGVGATFDYAAALHDLDSLGPDAVSDAILWRLRSDSPVKTDFYLGTAITGFVEKAVKSETKEKKP